MNENPAAAPPIGGGWFVLGAAAVASLAVAVWLVASNALFLARAQRAPGQIVGYVAHYGSKGSKAYAAFGRYTLPSGQSLTVESRTHAQLRFWPAVGAPVTVMVDPASPGRARLDLFVELWLMPVLLFAFSDLVLAVFILKSRFFRKV